MRSNKLALIRSTTVPTAEYLELFDDDDPIVRRWAVGAAGRLRDHNLLPYLYDALYDPDPKIRLDAFWSISLIGNHHDYELLCDTFNDEDACPYIRTMMAYALNYMRQRLNHY